MISRLKAAIVRRFTTSEPGGWTPNSQLADSGETITESSALALSAVWACTNLLAGTIGSLPLMVYRAADGYSAPDPEHELFKLLHTSPNADQTALDFWEFVSASIELWGNSYARVARNSQRKVTAIVPIHPSAVSVQRLSTGAIEYSWSENGRSFRGTDADILHIRGFGGDPLGGLSTLRFARNAFGLAQAVDRSASATFRNSLRPSGALVFDDWLSPDQRELAKTKLTEQFIGAQNTGKPMVLEGGTKWEPLTINPEDAQMLESRKFSVEEICRFFGVPPHMIGHTEKNSSWCTGIEEQTLAFQKYTLRRRLKRIEQAVSKQLLRPSDIASGVSIKFSVEGLLRGDSSGRAEFYDTMTRIGAMTINEVRELENMKPVEGGSVPRMQMQNVPITEAGNDDSS